MRIGGWDTPLTSQSSVGAQRSISSDPQRNQTGQLLVAGSSSLRVDSLFYTVAAPTCLSSNTVNFRRSPCQPCTNLWLCSHIFHSCVWTGPRVPVCSTPAAGGTSEPFQPAARARVTDRVKEPQGGLSQLSAPMMDEGVHYREDQRTRHRLSSGRTPGPASWGLQA